MPFTLRFDKEAAATIEELKNGDANATAKLEKVNRALGRLQLNPRHPGLNSYEYQNFKGGQRGVKIWHSYVENNTPGAWRIFWCYGPDETEKDPEGQGRQSAGDHYPPHQPAHLSYLDCLATVGEPLGALEITVCYFPARHVEVEQGRV